MRRVPFGGRRPPLSLFAEGRAAGLAPDLAPDRAAGRGDALPFPRRAVIAAAVIAAAALAAVTAPAARAATTYEVGPSQAYASIGAVPWEALQPGDVVRIHWRPTPYREKWVINRAGTAEAPIVVTGVPGPGGELPVIDGENATTRLALDYTGENRAVIKVGYSNVPADVLARHVRIENLDVRNARPPLAFTDDAGGTQAYAANAAAIWIEKGRDVTIRGCVLHAAGNGLFVSAYDGETRDILVEGNYVHDNGNVGSLYEHNAYTAALRITYQYNRFGPPCAGCSGNNLKDRSAGTVVRYNWIEGGNRQLDLVDAEDTEVLQNDPAYRATHVYGNVLVEPAGAGNRQVVHYGGDSGNTAIYRKGTLYFYANTVVSYRTDRTTLLRLSTNGERCDARDNVVTTAAAAGTTLSLLDTEGVLDWTHNFAKPGWVVSFGSFAGTFNDDLTTVQAAAPGFRDEASQDFRLAAGSPCRDAGAPWAAAVLPAHEPVREYVTHQAGGPRAKDAVPDIGAHEYAVPPVRRLRFTDRDTLSWDPVPDAATYDVVRGDLARLRGAGGDYAASAAACLANGLAGLSLDDPFLPAPGGAAYHLVRADAGTYDDEGAGLRPGRDAGLAGACP